MIYQKLYLLVAFTLLIITITKAQHTKQYQDSVRAQQILHVKSDLNLTADQFIMLKTIDSNYRSRMDSLNILNLSIEERKQGLQNIIAHYQKDIQSCFSAQQWQQCQDKQKAMQAAFEERMKQKKIKYTLLQ